MRLTGTLKTRKEATAWQKKFDAHAPKIGELASDFELRDSRGENPLRFFDLRGQQPVALIFGSFT